MPNDLRRLSKLMSLMLRHEPARFGLVLDAEGYTPLADLVATLRAQSPATDEADVRAVVDTVDTDKRRFTIDGDDIRANYGHSTADRIAHAPAVPPAELFHGTATETLEAIQSSGLRPMRRQYVHLTNDRALALRVGARHGRACLVRVNAGRAHADGIAFYRANDAFWLADRVPAEYLEPIE